MVQEFQAPQPFLAAIDHSIDLPAPSAMSNVTETENAYPAHADKTVAIDVEQKSPLMHFLLPILWGILAGIVIVAGGALALLMDTWTHR